MASVGAISWMRSLYHPAHLEGAFLVIAATDLREINQIVARDAGERNILVSCADDPSMGNYVTGASIDRGGLQVSLTTSGASPTLTSVLRARLDKQFGEEWSNWVSLFAALRSDIQRLPAEHLRKSVVQEILSDKIVTESVLCGDIISAEGEAKKCILSHLD
jgi:precorrin-2 dehydrogenase/sirohydrochlorin ferrochelatase